MSIVWIPIKQVLVDISLAARRSLSANISRNGAFLVVPVLIWNITFWPQLPADADIFESPSWVFQWTEHGLRFLAFSFPVLLTFRSDELSGYVGWTTYRVGLVLYFVCWVPWLEGSEPDSIALQLGPYVTPLLVFAGIAILCRSRLYILISTAFVALHASLGLVGG